MRFCLYVILTPGFLSAGTAVTGIAHLRTRAQVAPVVRSDPRSGQLVRTVVITSRVVESRTVAPGAAGVAEQAEPILARPDMKSLVEETAKNYALNPELVDSVIQVESNYNPRAVSPKGAQGLMQLMPATARRFGVVNSFDPKQNIEGGVRYLKFLQDRFKDDRLAIAAYNAGEGAVDRYGNVPPYAETIDYVAKVGKKIGQARRTAHASVKAEAAPADTTPKAPVYRRLAQFSDSDGRIFLTTQ